MENTNKVIEAILTKIVRRHHNDWADRLPKALWANRITWCNTMGFPPYDLVYGKNVSFPTKFEIKTLKTAMEENLDLTEPQRNI